MSEHHDFSDQHAAPKTQVPEVLLNNPEAMQKPKELLKLEIGAATDAGFSEYKLAYSGATIVTVNAPYGLDRGDTILLNDTHADSSAYSLVGNQRLAKNLRDAIEQRGESEYSYAFIPIVGDGRQMDYFEDGTFSEVMLHNVISDPSIEAQSATCLIVEALRVGDEVHLSEDMTAFATQWRLDHSNLEEAGIIRTTVITLDEKYGDTSEEVLTKAENFGQTALTFPTETPIYFRDYQRLKKAEDAQRQADERDAAWNQERKERKERRRAKRANILAKFGISKTVE